MKRALVTGASGFIGRHCLHALRSADFEVHGVSFHGPGEGDALWHRTDLLDPYQTARLLEEVRPTHLVHAAWYVEPGVYPSSPENLAWVQASLSLLRSFRELGGQRFLGIGSCYEYDWSAPVLSEADSLLRPRTVYGKCKKALFELSTVFADCVGLSAAWARPFFLFGPHQHRRYLVANVVTSLLEGRPAACSHGRQVRDYMSVADLGKALVALLDSPVEGAVNIASGKPVPVADLVNIIARSLNGGELIQWGAVPVPADDPPRLEADISRLRDEVGWRPTLTLEEGLMETIAWWQASLGEVALR